MMMFLKPKIKTEEGEFFKGDTIIELRYDVNKVGMTGLLVKRSWRKRQ
jgi:hypothetical protein